MDETANLNSLKPKNPKAANETKQSALAVARLILNAKKVIDRHKNDVLNYVLWKLTEADYPKHRLPFRTVEAHREVLKGGTLRKRLRHEHVFPRKWVVERIFERPEKVEQLLCQYGVGCVVTIEQANALNQQDRLRKKHGESNLVGWLRYEKLSFQVIQIAFDGTEIAGYPDSIACG